MIKMKTKTELENEKNCSHNRTRELRSDIVCGTKYIEIKCLDCEKEWQNREVSL